MKNIKLIFTIFILFVFSIQANAYQEETLLLLDSTGSMIEEFQGKTKIELGAQAVFNILDKMNDSERVGLRTIGVHPSQIPRLLRIASRQEVCRQTLLLNSIQTNNKNNIRNSLSSLFPFGPSPLEFALKEVIQNDFTVGTAHKRIILITDGYETCDGDPCGFVQKLRRSRPDITIDIVAIGASNSELSSLSCLTKATNGNIYDIKTIAELEALAKEISTTSQNYYNQENNSLLKQLNQLHNIEIDYQPTIRNNDIKYRHYLLEFSE